MSQKKDKQPNKKNWYGMFKKAKGFDRNDPTLPPIVQQPIEFLIHHGKYHADYEDDSNDQWFAPQGMKLINSISFGFDQTALGLLF